MKVAVIGHPGELLNATVAELERRGMTVSDKQAECAICLAPEMVEAALATAQLRRLVLRSTAYVYGANSMNPGLLTEDRISLLPPAATEQRWLRAEEIAQKFPSTAILRMSSILSTQEGDLIVSRLAGKSSVTPAGFDPNVQFLSVRDAAAALVSAAASSATGVFNAGGAGAIPLRKAFRASGTGRFPLSGGVKLQAMQYSWTVSGERAERELGFVPSQTSIEALAEFLKNKPGARPDLLAKSYDEFGLDVDYIRAWGWWFAFLRKVYWRIEHEGLENIPDVGRGMFVSNHRGFMPLDAVMHLSLILTHRQRI
ncbi:MAG: hypothetical protein ABIZ80_19660, partial [Bryobacteraceae bacterium]